eukprot:182696-Alexandrium_andersonii.AAC.1
MRGTARMRQLTSPDAHPSLPCCAAGLSQMRPEDGQATGRTRLKVHARPTAGPSAKAALKP